MYSTFFNLNRRPFQLDTDPSFLWLGPTHKEALATMRHCLINKKGFAAITGNVGAGKTTLINALVEDLDKDVLVVKVTNPALGLVDFFNVLASSLKIQKQFKSKGDFIVYFSDFIEQQSHANKRVLVIVDEAHKLNSQFLEEIRLLSNSVGPGKNIITFFLVGQNELNQIILSDECVALRQRISLNYQVEPLTEIETEQYIRFRMEVAGTREDIFNADVVSEVYHFSQGNPRLINMICDRALLTAYVDTTGIITSDIIQECSNELLLPGEKQSDLLNSLSGQPKAECTTLESFHSLIKKKNHKINCFFNRCFLARFNPDLKVNVLIAALICIAVSTLLLKDILTPALNDGIPDEEISALYAAGGTDQEKIPNTFVFNTTKATLIQAGKVSDAPGQEEKSVPVQPVNKYPSSLSAAIATTRQKFDEHDVQPKIYPVTEVNKGKEQDEKPSADNGATSIRQDQPISTVPLSSPHFSAESDSVKRVEEKTSDKDQTVSDPSLSSPVAITTTRQGGEQRVEQQFSLDLIKGLLEKEKFSEAAALLEDAMKSETGEKIDIKTLYTRALRGKAGQLMKKDQKRSEELLLKAVTVDAANYMTYFDLGKVYTIQKNYEKAIDAYGKSIQINSVFSGTYYNLGVVYSILKKYSRAEKMFIQSADLQPAYLDKVLFNMAIMQRKQGKKQQCIVNLENALKVNPDNKKIEKVLKMMKAEAGST